MMRAANPRTPRYSECVMIGDSTDVFVGLLTGMPVIGHASKPGKTQALADVTGRRHHR